LLTKYDIGKPHLASPWIRGGTERGGVVIMILTKEFYQSKNTPKIAQNVLGCFLVRKIGGEKRKILITETECYHGFTDLASHASKGKTLRNEVMFGSAGRIYVYLVYGMHYMLNIVTGPEDYPAAVLIRGGLDMESGASLNGPAKLTKAIKIDKGFNGLPVYEKKHGLWIEGREDNDFRIIKSKRVGVDYAGDYKDKLWNFKLERKKRPEGGGGRPLE
jgi:DNA-3-methyladenine glycosylase